ncbi:hypothetical protein F511_43046 [Dorcoceras hygrometricum]|uniref:Uncharacterized protein n=1 Tax=Dorcoceras hygrometricum TaxID=472368 RepID=A0A2Z7CWD2_9LAMI|nr:hypothetical protein F511_43046 [Dorcoceras hygrometricum]
MQSHQSSSCDLQVRRLSRPSQGSVVFRRNDSAGHHIKTTYDDSADHHKAVWYSGATTQLATTSKQRWTFQARRLSRPITTCKGIQLSIESGSKCMLECTADSCLINAYITRANKNEHRSRSYKTEGRSNQLKFTAHAAPLPLSRSYYKLKSVKSSTAETDLSLATSERANYQRSTQLLTNTRQLLAPALTLTAASRYTLTAELTSVDIWSRYY